MLRTFFTLAGTSVLRGQDSDVADCVLRTGITPSACMIFLKSVAELVAVDAAELARIALKQSCGEQIDNPTCLDERAAAAGER